MLYLIRNTRDGYLKIGVSDNPRHRLRQLQTASPYRLELLGAIDGGIDEERKLHQMLCEHRLCGEWFKPEHKVVRTVWPLFGLSEWGDLSMVDEILGWDEQMAEAMFASAPEASFIEF